MFPPFIESSSDPLEINIQELSAIIYALWDPTCLQN